MGPIPAHSGRWRSPYAGDSDAPASWGPFRLTLGTGAHLTLAILMRQRHEAHFGSLITLAAS